MATKVAGIIYAFAGGLLFGSLITGAKAAEPTPTYIVGLDLEQVAPAGTLPQQNMNAVSVKIERKSKLVKLQGNVQISNFNPNVRGTFIETLFTWYLTPYALPSPMCCSYEDFIPVPSNRIAGEIVETYNDTESHQIHLEFNLDIPAGYYLSAIIDCNARQVPIHAEAQIYAVIEDFAQMDWIIEGDAGMKGYVEAKPYMMWYVKTPINAVISFGSPTDIPATWVDTNGTDQLAVIRYDERKVYLDTGYSGGGAEIIMSFDQIEIISRPAYTSKIRFI